MDLLTSEAFTVLVRGVNVYKLSVTQSYLNFTTKDCMNIMSNSTTVNLGLRPRTCSYFVLFVPPSAILIWKFLLSLQIVLGTVGWNRVFIDIL